MFKSKTFRKSLITQTMKHIQCSKWYKIHYTVLRLLSPNSETMKGGNKEQKEA